MPSATDLALLLNKTTTLTNSVNSWRISTDQDLRNAALRTSGDERSDKCAKSVLLISHSSRAALLRELSKFISETAPLVREDWEDAVTSMPLMEQRDRIYIQDTALRAHVVVALHHARLMRSELSGIRSLMEQQSQLTNPEKPVPNPNPGCVLDRELVKRLGGEGPNPKEPVPITRPFDMLSDRLRQTLSQVDFGSGKGVIPTTDGLKESHLIKLRTGKTKQTTLEEVEEVEETTIEIDDRQRVEDGLIERRYRLEHDLYDWLTNDYPSM